jgi:flavin-dependent dehydrogenase
MRVGIIGAGVCGLYLAWKLRDHDVTIFEQNKKIGKKACSGLVSERIWDFIPKKKQLIRNVITKAELHFPKKTIKMRLSPNMIVVDHEKLDKYVYSLAKPEIKFEKVKKVYSVKKSKPQISADRLYEFDRLIGCDGPLSLTRKTLGFRDPNFRLGIFTKINKKIKSDKFEIYPLKNGFVLEDVNKAEKIFKKFARKKEKVYSALIPQGFQRVSKGNIAICGDAAGLTKPWSGGGIIWSLIAANILVKIFPNFKKYDREVQRFFDPKILSSKLAAKIGIWSGRNLSGLISKEIPFDSDWIF